MPRKPPKGAWISEQLCVQMARACNLACIYCQNPPAGERRPSIQETEDLIREGRIRAVSLEGGGEPTVNRDFFDWIGSLKAAGVENFMLSTNAVALSDPELCRRVEKAVDQFTVNLPASDPDTYRKATRTGKFALAVKGLENLKALGAVHRIRLFHIIFSGNYRALPAFAAWVSEKFPGVAFVNLTFVRNLGRAAAADGIVPRYSETWPFVKIALAVLKRNGIRAVIQNMPLCMLTNFEGFSFEFQRWRRGDRVLERGVAGRAERDCCAHCALRPACCGARPDYLKLHGGGELKASAKDPGTIRAEMF